MGRPSVSCFLLCSEWVDTSAFLIPCRSPFSYGTGLSQMLADEEYEEEIDDHGEEAPMTFEKFAEETEKLIEQAEDERKETEAILRAPPNANFLEGTEEDYPTERVENSIERGIIASDAFEDMIMELAEGEKEREGSDEGEDNGATEIISHAEIDVLQMDDFEGDTLDAQPINNDDE